MTAILTGAVDCEGRFAANWQLRTFTDLGEAALIDQEQRIPNSTG